jgi:hypothetical protein
VNNVDRREKREKVKKEAAGSIHQGNRNQIALQLPTKLSDQLE